MKFSGLIIFFLALPFFGGAQKQGNNWIFGNKCNLSFASGAPVAGAPSAINTQEGCASVSDASGNLLFYTDGVKVWNRNNQVMPNGGGLLGNTTSAQSGLIVPWPGHCSKYFVFAVDWQDGGNGTTYSVVDMTLDGGLGNVNATKNVLLAAYGWEKLTVVQNCNGVDYWVADPDFYSDNLNAFAVTSAGVNPVPVTSNVGSFIPDINALTGCIKFSPDGSKVAAGIWESNGFSVADFNACTGVASNTILLTDPRFTYAYSVQFSPDSKLLYGTTQGDTSYVYQFNLEAGTPAQILNTAVQVYARDTIVFFGDLQTGLDKKIYIADLYQSFLSVINNPDTLGVGCQFVYKGFNLPNTMLCIEGLPAFTPNYFNPVLPVYHVQASTGNCNGLASFSISDTTNISSINWNFADPASGSADTSSSFSPQHIFSSTNTYIVRAIVNTECVIDTLTDTVPVASITPQINLGPDTNIDCSNQAIILNATTSGATYLWQDSSTLPTDTVTHTGTYRVVVTVGGCSAVDSVHINYGLPSIIINSNFDTICPSDSAKICAPTGFSTYTWNPATGGTTGACIEATGAGNYYVTAADSNGCTAQSNSVGITVRQAPAAIIIANADTICPSDSAQICAPESYSSYNWNTGLTSRCIQVQTAGDYYVSVTDNHGCTAESNHLGITVLLPPPISISRIGDTLRIYDATNVQWYRNDSAISGATQNIYIANTFGTYTVSITDSDGCTTFSSPVYYTGITDISADDNVSVYPNPLSVGKWQMAVGNDMLGGELEILDAEGRVVYKSEIKNIHSEIEAPVAEGVYLLRIVTGAGVVARKLVKL